jgi:hypothetical protein
MEGDFCYGLFPANHQPLLHALLAEKEILVAVLRAVPGFPSARPGICVVHCPGAGCHLIMSRLILLDIVGIFLTIMKRLFHAENAAEDVGFPAH